MIKLFVGFLFAFPHHIYGYKRIKGLNNLVFQTLLTEREQAKNVFFVKNRENSRKAIVVLVESYVHA